MSSPWGGNINGLGPEVFSPGVGVISIAHSNKDDGHLDLTIDMTYEQAEVLAEKLGYMARHFLSNDTRSAWELDSWREQNGWVNDI